MDRLTIKATINCLLISIMIILISGCINDKTQPGETLQRPAQTDAAIPGTPIEKISNELNMLESKGWYKLSRKLGAAKTTALLWYHLKSGYGIDIKMVFGNPNKLDSALAIMVTKGGDSSFPKIRIKGIEYYIINPKTPAVIDEFNYGDMFDDPGGSDNFLADRFRLRQADVDMIEEWMRETGVTIRYTDIPR